MKLHKGHLALLHVNVNLVRGEILKQKKTKILSLKKATKMSLNLTFKMINLQMLAVENIKISIFYRFNQSLKIEFQTKKKLNKI